MKNEMLTYETPHVEIIEVEVENGFAISGGNMENPSEGETVSW